MFCFVYYKDPPPLKCHIDSPINVWLCVCVFCTFLDYVLEYLSLRMRRQSNPSCHLPSDLVVSAIGTGERAVAFIQAKSQTIDAVQYIYIFNSLDCLLPVCYVCVRVLALWLTDQLMRRESGFEGPHRQEYVTRRHVQDLLK